MSATYEVRDGIAVVSLSNPPVNGLGHATRKEIEERRVGKECIPPCRSRWSPYH